MQTEGQRRASRAVGNWLAADGRGNAWLIDKAEADKGTVGTFLAGKTWPRRPTLARIEGALGWSVGTITDIAEGLIDPPVLVVEERQPLTNQDLVAEIARRLGVHITLPEPSRSTAMLASGEADGPHVGLIDEEAEGISAADSPPVPAARPQPAPSRLGSE